MVRRQVADRLDDVRGRIAAACAGTGRSADTVRLVAVSKRIPLPFVVEACRAGQWAFGENRVADALSRQVELTRELMTAGLDPRQLSWHFIGHLQRNKSNRAAGAFALLHGLESLDLAERLSSRSHAEGAVQPVLLQVNVAGEAQKYGVAPEKVGPLAAAVAALPGVSLQGLMGMARRDDTPVAVGETFAALRRLSEETRLETGLPLPELSMGMSNDFEIAIAEGATIVRVGSAIFGPRAA